MRFRRHAGEEGRSISAGCGIASRRSWKLISLKQAAESHAAKSDVSTGKIKPKDYKGRVWVTRRRPGVDRCASAWLIRRLIDRKARFAFAPEERVPAGAVPFDMFHGEGFGHRGLHL